MHLHLMLLNKIKVDPYYLRLNNRAELQTSKATQAISINLQSQYFPNQIQWIPEPGFTYFSV